MSKNQIGKVVHVVSYEKLLNYTWNFCKCGSTRHGFYQAHNNRMIYQYGVENEKNLTMAYLEFSSYNVLGGDIVYEPRKIFHVS